MTAHDVNADVRARFEAWAREAEGLNLVCVLGRYTSAQTRSAWNAYRAAHADLAGEVRELVEAALRDAGKVAHLYHNGAGMLWYVNGELEKRLAKFHPDRRAANYVSGHVDDAGTFHPTHQEKP